MARRAASCRSFGNRLATPGAVPHVAGGRPEPSPHVGGVTVQAGRGGLLVASGRDEVSRRLATRASIVGSAGSDLAWLLSGRDRRGGCRGGRRARVSEAGRLRPAADLRLRRGRLPPLPYSGKRRVRGRAGVVHDAHPARRGRGADGRSSRNSGRPRSLDPRGPRSLDLDPRVHVAVVSRKGASADSHRQRPSGPSNPPLYRRGAGNRHLASRRLRGKMRSVLGVHRCSPGASAQVGSYPDLSALFLNGLGVCNPRRAPQYRRGCGR